MYDILELKGKLLPELQGIAKELTIPKFRALKKMDLIYQILDVQAINPKSSPKPSNEAKVTPKEVSKPKPVKKPEVKKAIVKKTTTELIPKETKTVETPKKTITETEEKKPEVKIVPTENDGITKPTDRTLQARLNPDKPNPRDKAQRPRRKKESQL